MTARRTLFAAFVVGAIASANSRAMGQVAGGGDNRADPADVEFFERKVRPLLVARCHECHGPEKHKANLRLDSRAGVLAGGDTGAAVVPGKPDESLLVDAIRYGQLYQMPPKSQLPADEIATLVEWVRRGVPWGAETAPVAIGGKADFNLAERAKHWSFQRPAAVEPPAVNDARWVRTAVDRFILARLAEAGLSPAPACDKRMLLRRVTYDLSGLPPTIEQIDDFLADDSPGAYERVVDRLLASPRYGERWARHWLDLVRYAETYGHEFDFEIPGAYRYRDYVIRALNDDVPYDQFVTEHVAGDLLRAPRRNPQQAFNESILATGSFFFGEAKHSPVDARGDEADRVDNQIDVFAKTFLGLTVSCARCHDHKFDAISTKDYYALAGYLQSSRYQQAFIDDGAAEQAVVADLAAIDRERAGACADVARAVLGSQLDRLADTMMAGRESRAGDPWGTYLRETALVQSDDVFHPWAVLTKDAAVEGDAFIARRAELAQRIQRQPIVDPAAAPMVFADFSGPDYGEWVATGSAFGSRPARALDWDFSRPRGRLPGQLVEAPAAHSGLVSRKLRGVLRSPTFEITKPKIFYRVYGDGGHVRLVVDGLQLIRDPIYGGLDFTPAGPRPKWHTQDVSKWIGHRAYIELVDEGEQYLALERVAFGETAPGESVPNRLVGEMLADEMIRSPSGLATRYEQLLRQVFAAWQGAADASQERAGDRAAIINWILDQHVPGGEALAPRIDEFAVASAALDTRRQQVEGRLTPPQQAVAMADGTAENEHVFIRGSHKTLGEEVPRRFLEALGGTAHAPPTTGSGRLELARQLVDPANPLVARVMANRIWKHHFGEGIVRSCDDFGVMGQPPTHPALLDWLAGEFVRGGWSIKAMHRLLVLSNTYQMSSRPQGEAEVADPQNKLLHRMVVRRLEAECIRDAMLAVSGRLEPKMFGPSVMPYLTPHMTGRGRPAASGPLDGDGRRSIYLAVRRNFLPPMFLAFDYPTPFTTIGRRSTSNVPAQALAMMNNPLVVEQAKRWAQRVAAENSRSVAERVATMYQTALARDPDGDELASAVEFVNSAGEEGRGQAWAELAHVIMNLKEFIFIP